MRDFSPVRASGRAIISAMGTKDSYSWTYGLNPVLEALKAGRPVRAVHVSTGRRGGTKVLRDEARRRGVPVKTVGPEFFVRFPKGHQGIAAEVTAKGYVELEELMAIPEAKGQAPFFVILDLVEDPRNLGAVLRTAEAAGVHGVVVQSRRAAGLTPEAVRSSAGAAEHIAVSSVTNIKHAMDRMKEAGVLLVGAEAGSGGPPWEAELTGPVALVVGSEGKGLRRTVRERCDLLLSLPVPGRVGSLNASVAAGVFIYEVLRQRMAQRADL